MAAVGTMLRTAGWKPALPGAQAFVPCHSSREAALAREIAAAKAALAQEQAAVDEAARQAAAERARKQAEQEERTQAAIALEEARAIESEQKLAKDIDTFVSAWGEALDRGDYKLYRELGFRELPPERWF